MFVWTFLLRITQTIISQSIADSSWITVYIKFNLKQQRYLCSKQKGTEQPWNAVCPLWRNKCMLEWSRSFGKATRWASQSMLISESFVLERSPLSAQIKTLGKQPTEMHSTSAVVRLSWFVGSYRISFGSLMKVYLLVWLLLPVLFVWFIWLLWYGS